jgi:hypothetical protein
MRVCSIYIGIYGDDEAPVGFAYKKSYINGVIRITQIQQWFLGQFTPEMLRKNAAQLIGAGFLVIFIIFSFYGYLWYSDNSRLRAQDLQVVNDCKGKYSKEFSGHSLSFEDIAPLRFGNDHIIVTGEASYADTDGSIRTVKVSCDVSANQRGS